MKFCLKHRGSISLFLSIILIPTLIFTGIMVDYANLNLSKGVVEGAGDLASNAALANYDTVLNEVYGLFAMSQNADNPQEALQENLEEYFNNTLYASGLIESEYDLQSETMKAIRDMFINTNVQESFLGTIPVEGTFEANYIEGSDLANPENLKRQIVEFVKYRGPAEVGLSLLDSLGAVKKVNAQSEVATTKVQVDESIEDLAGENAKFFQALKRYDLKVEEYRIAETRFLKEKDKIQKSLYRVGEVTMMYLLHPIDTSGLVYVSSDGSGGEQGGSVSGSTLDELASFADEMIQRINGEKQGAIQASLGTLGNDVKVNNIKNLEECIKHYRNYMPDVSNLCAARNAVASITIEYPTKPSEPSKPGTNATIKEITSYNQQMQNHQSKMEEYNAKQKEAEEKQKKKDDLLKRIKEKLSSIGSSICEPMKSNMTAYDTAKKTAVEDGTSKITYCYKELASYYKACASLGVDKNIEFDWFNTENCSLIDFALLKAGRVKEEIRKVNEKITTFEASNDNYSKEETTDGYYAQMANQADKYKSQFKEYGVDEIVRQLEAAKYYLTHEPEPLGVVPYLQQLTFYTPVIINGVATLEQATNGMKTGIGAKVEADIASGTSISGQYIIDNRDESWDMKKDTVIGKKTKEYYVKKIGENAFETEANLYENISSYYVYLTRSCGMTIRDTDKKSENTELKKEVKEKNSVAKKEAEKPSVGGSSSESAKEYHYSAGVFADTPSAEHEGSAPKFDELYQSDNSNKGTTEQFSKMQGYFSSNVQGIKDTISNEVDNLLISEYIFQNFSFATGEIMAKKEAQENKGKGYTTLTNIPINAENNVIYGCEVEYILYGHKQGQWEWFQTEGPECNISNAKRDIFAMRFMCNSVFALTDAEIDKITMPPALAIQAAFSGAVPYQLVQTTFKLALALAESTHDLDRLMKGEKVALLKSRETFTFSPTGVKNAGEEFLVQKIEEGTGAVAEVTLGAIQGAVDQAGEYVEGEITSIVGNVAEQGSKAAVGALEDMVSTIVNTVTDTVEQEFMRLYDENVTYSLAALEQAVNEKLDGLAVSQSEEVNAFIEEVRGGITAAILEPVDGELQAAYQELKEIAQRKTGVTLNADRFRNIEEHMHELARNYQKKFTQQIQKVANNIGREVSKLAGEHLQKAGDIVSGKAETIINEQGEKLSRETSKLFNQYFPSETTVIDGMTDPNRNVVAEKTFECSYEDYLRIFLFLKIQTGQQDILLRIADLIQINVGTGMKGYGKSYLEKDGATAPHRKGDAFRMKEAYTYVELNTEVKVKPLLISLDLFTPEGQTPLKYWYYDYKTIAGY